MLEKKITKADVHEIKFTIRNSKSHQAIKWLQHSCIPDPEYPTGTVSSIYYDTQSWRFLYEKINSDFMKIKVRVRWYSDINKRQDFEKSFVEAKFKIGSRRKKVRTITPYSGAWLSKCRLDNSRLLEIPFLLRKEGIVISQNIFPVYQISYKRLRFIEPYAGYRICFDYDISTPRVNGYMLPKSNPFMLQTAVFEIKGSVDELPFYLYPLTDMGFRKVSFSKYKACYEKIMRAYF